MDSRFVSQEQLGLDREICHGLCLAITSEKMFDTYIEHERAYKGIQILVNCKIPFNLSEN